MKRILLNIALVLGTASLSYAQFTFDPSIAAATGVTFAAGTAYADGITPQGCNNYMPEPTTTAPGLLYTFQNYGNSVYSGNTCTGTALAVGAGVGPGNGGTYAVPGSVGFGLNIAAGYTQASWSPYACVDVVPSFGFNFSTECPAAGNNWNTLAAGANPVDVDLTATAGQKLYVNYIGQAGSGTPTFNTKLQLFRDPSGDAGAGVFGGTAGVQPSADFILDNTARQLVIDFSGATISSSAILAEVRQISFLYYGTTITDNYNLKIFGFSIGSATPLTVPVTATKSATESIASSKLYPNPVADEATVELNLKSASTVKVTLSDLMGKEVMTIADGTFSTLTEEFSVAGLNKGIYTVNYFVNGAAAKAELLMVK